MSLIDRHQLSNQLVPPLDRGLCESLISEFISIERRFVLRDWEPAEFDAGHFCELLARLLFHQDSGTLKPGQEFGKCVEYILDPDGSRHHQVSTRHDAIHLAHVLKLTYKFRSQRGVAHVSPTYSPNEMDCKWMIACVRWCMAEVVRIFSKADRDLASQTIREIIQFDVPCIGRFEDDILVQRTDLSVDEEILVLLHYAGDSGFSRREIGRYARLPSQRVSDGLKRLSAPSCRQIILLKDGIYRLTELGCKRVLDELATKLSILLNS